MLCLHRVYFVSSCINVYASCFQCVYFVSSHISVYASHFQCVYFVSSCISVYASCFNMSTSCLYTITCIPHVLICSYVFVVVATLGRSNSWAHSSCMFCVLFVCFFPYVFDIYLCISSCLKNLMCIYISI